jgi:hypothetical protein
MRERLAGKETSSKRSSMKRYFLFAWLITMVLPAHAHGNFEHILGTIKAVHEDSVTVETPAHEIRTVNFTEKTAFRQGVHAVTWKELQPGQKVVIHAKKVSGSLQAHEVKIAPVSRAP